MLTKTGRLKGMNFKNSNYREAQNDKECCIMCDYHGAHRKMFMRLCLLFSNEKITKVSYMSYDLEKKHGSMICDNFIPIVERVNGYEVDKNKRYWKIYSLDMEGRYPVNILGIVKSEKKEDKQKIKKKLINRKIIKYDVFTLEETTLKELQKEIEEKETSLQQYKKMYSNLIKI